MYTDFYGLREKPFSLSPDPRFLYLAASHREALAHLLYGIDEGEGFIAVTGEVGTGKTTLCRSLLDRLGSETEVAFLFNPSGTAGELLHAIAREFGFDDRTASRHELGDRLNRFLLDRKRDGRRVLLIVDEAQNLSDGTLEQIRLLSNLETSSEKLIQILLLGQPELDEKLDSPALRQLRQRISVRWGLGPLSAGETREYVRHRMRIAAAGECDVFDDAALAEVHRRTRGVPRLVNVLCDRALLAGYAEGLRRIGVDVVRAAADEIPDTRGRALRRSGAGRSGARGRVARVLGGGLLVAVAAAAGFYYEDLGDGLRALVPPGASSPVAASSQPPVRASNPSVSDPSASDPSASTSAVPAVSTAPAPVAARVADPSVLPAAAPLASGEDLRAARGRALNTLLASFGIEGLSTPPADDAALLEILELRGLAVLELRDTSLAMLRRLNHPALLPLRMRTERTGQIGRMGTAAGDEGPVLAALLNLDDAAGTFYGATARGPLRLDVAEIEARWDRRAFVVWREFAAVPEVIGPSSEPESVIWLQESLARLGLYAGAPSGRFDARTVEGVRTLQLTRQLEPDGAVGPRTKMVLYDLLDRYTVPRLAAGGTAG
ncbi:MAG: AAA family ATPase [Myxococcota bacterium]